METKPRRPFKPAATDKYHGLKRESIVVIMTDKDGKQTKVKL
jgi:hypothetical protein